MNANQMINMAIRMVMRRLMRGGVTAGIDAIARGKGRGEATDRPGQGDARTRETATRLRQTTRMMRRFGRF